MMDRQDYYELMDILDLNLPKIIFKSIGFLLAPISLMALTQWYEFRILVKRTPPNNLNNPDPFRKGYGIKYAVTSYKYVIKNYMRYFGSKSQRGDEASYCAGVPVRAYFQYHLWWAHRYYFEGRERRDPEKFKQSEQIYKRLANEATTEPAERWKYLRSALLAWCEYALIEYKEGKVNDISLSDYRRELWDVCQECPGSNNNQPSQPDDCPECSKSRARTCRTLAYVLHRFYSNGISKIRIAGKQNKEGKNEFNISNIGDQCYKYVRKLYTSIPSLHFSRLKQHAESFHESKLPPIYGSKRNRLYRLIPLIAPVFTLIGALLLIYDVMLWRRNLPFMDFFNFGYPMVFVLSLFLAVIFRFGEFLWHASHEILPSHVMKPSSSTPQGVSFPGGGIPDYARQWRIHLTRNGGETQQADIKVNEPLYLTLNPSPEISSHPPGPLPGVRLTLIDNEHLDIQKASGSDLENYQFYVIESSSPARKLIPLQKNISLPAEIQIQQGGTTIATVSVDLHK